MRAGKASFSAEIVAIARAVESRKGPEKRLFNDPLALGLLRPVFRLLVKTPLFRHLLLAIIERKGPGFIGGIAVRTRFIDDLLQAQLQTGLEQLVILGAGYDARAYRTPDLEKVQVFEVDFAPTQLYKKSRLAGLLGRLPENVSFVPIDFNQQSLANVLLQAGFDKRRKTFFIWEGVTMYLEAEAVAQTFQTIQLLSKKQNSLYFDYMLLEVLDGRSQLPEARKIRADGTFGKVGDEAYRFGIEDGTIKDYLAQQHFSLKADVKGAELAQRYFGQTESPYVHQLFGYVHATTA